MLVDVGKIASSVAAADSSGCGCCCGCCSVCGCSAAVDEGPVKEVMVMLEDKRETNWHSLYEKLLKNTQLSNCVLERKRDSFQLALLCC